MTTPKIPNLDVRAALRFVAGILVAGVTAVSVAVIPAQSANAATDTVTNCGGGLINPGTLPWTVEHASPGDTINFDVSCKKIKVTRTIDLSSNLTIAGPGAAELAVSGRGRRSVFLVDSDVTISGLTIEQGTGTLQGLGGLGGGIYNSGTLTLSNCIVSDNVSFHSGGGGIYNTGTLTIINTTLSGNTTQSAPGGGIQNEGTLTLINSTLTHNRAGKPLNNGDGGGGIYNEGALTVMDSTMSKNVANGLGGAIENDGAVTINASTLAQNMGAAGGIYSSGGTIGVTGSTISGNVGGGIDNSSGTMTITDSTVSDNNIPSRPGGGIENAGTLALTDSSVTNNTSHTLGGGGIYNQGTFTMTDSTVSNNTAAGPGNGIENVGVATIDASTLSQNMGHPGGGLVNMGGNVSVNSSTIWSNFGDGIVDSSGTVNAAATIVANCSGTIGDAGYNLDEDGSCGFSAAHQSQSGVNPELGPLQNNGGPTDTEAPATDSPTLNQIPLGTMANGILLCPGTDQRGVDRPQGTECDIGAVELVPASPAIGAHHRGVPRRF